VSKKIHPSTTFGLALDLVAIAFLLVGYPIVSASLALVGYFASIKEVSKYTSLYQFVVVFLSAIVLGQAIDQPFGVFPWMTICLAFAAAGSIIRIAFFSVFSYTGHSWWEPSMFILALGLYVAGNLLGNTGWMGWSFPPVIILFTGILAWGILKDKKQLLAYTQGGYKVKIGAPASEFALPDQDGNIVQLSDFKNQRHLLLIFVRGDWCPGCHMMLRAYEKNREKFASKNVMVMAIGPDPVGVNRGMVEKLGVDFKVLADEKQRTAQVYGVQLAEYDNDFAEKYDEGIPLPASFLIDKNGIVRYVSRPDKVGEFLNPFLIFPIVEKLDGTYKETASRPETREMEKPKTAALSKKELSNIQATITELKKQLTNYESIIDQANDAMMVIDIVDGKVHQSNPSASKLLGYSQAELAGMSLFDLHPKEYLQKSSSIVADVWEKGGFIYSDIPFVTKDKIEIPVECSAKVAPFSGRPAIVIYARDITERLRMEAEIREQSRELEEKNRDIVDSIEYSKRIQRSIFLEKEKLKDAAPESFIYFKPRDVVSGDFYWFSKVTLDYDLQTEHGHAYKEGTDILVVAAVDCTGHGVPGAFMSIIGNTLLNQTLNNLKVNSAALTLDYVNQELKRALNKNREDIPLRDGMDIVLCYVDVKNRKLEYAGANNPLYLVRNKELIKFTADKMPITASLESEAKPFTNNKIDLEPGDCIYLFTDGYADQFGGPKGKKFMYKPFGELLCSISDKPMDDQKRILYETFEAWKGNLAQVDDALVIGIRV
jgi:PAS domain S-box-containing protein